MKIAKQRKYYRRRPSYTLAELLMQMPNLGTDEDFYRSDSEIRAWMDMQPVGREFGGDMEPTLPSSAAVRAILQMMRTQKRKRKGRGINFRELINDGRK